MIIKPITGTWFEFQHHNIPEGKYWNPIVKGFSDAQWEAKVDEIASLGMKYIVLLTTSQVYEDTAYSFYETDIYPFADIAAKDPMGALFNAADRNGIKVFVSCGYYGNWVETINNMVSPEVQARAFKSMEQVYAKYGHHESFYGWYLPDETGIYPYYDERFIKYVNDYSAFGRTIDPKLKMLIAPYGTNSLKADDKYVAQLESLDCDIIAYQDEIGVRKSLPEATGAYYEALRKAHDKAGRSALWADMEVFEFEGDVYRSALYAAAMERIDRQIKSISPYVDEILIYQYQGMFNKPGTIAYCGHPDSLKLYNDYKAWLENLNK
ncbi:MAG: DUF4434 domain-containing protein [Clostridia bacterium]|nr:DUF4434 domain-containing protein [Clostridia bacterium]MBQ9848251.1 DUF4434 domain-containing protein [Clostridia bacterium]